MKLKKKYATLEEIPEAMRSLYVKHSDGSYVLEVDDPEFEDLNRKVKEFRDNNITLSKERQQALDALKKFEGVDPEKYQEAVEALNVINSLEEKDLLKAGKLDEVVERRLGAFRKSAEEREKALLKEKTALEQTASKYRDSYSKLRIAQSVDESISAIGVLKPGARSDLMRRANEVWRLNDKDELEAPETFGEDGKPISLEEWGKGLLKTAPYLFESGGGGGAPGGAKKPGQTGPAPKVIRGDNAEAFGANLKDIASGKVKVQMQTIQGGQG